jgi:hypothetical protein
MPCAINASDLAMFQCLLIGSWSNENDKELTYGGKPLSYNVMPLPQVDVQTNRPLGGSYGGFILKNFTFTETIRFNGSIMKNDPPEHLDPEALAVVAGAPNRGGSYTQFAHAVFYDQQVHFAEGPAQGKVVHVENGAWLHLGSRPQLTGPYNAGSAIKDGQVLKQPPYITIAKQIAVPHGNSVLALGSVDLYDRDHFDDDASGINANTVIPGAPVIPDAFVPYPAPADIATAPFEDPYAATLNAMSLPPDDFENPDPVSTLNPNLPLQRALNIIKPKAHIHWRVTTEPLFGGRGSVTNIPFEDRKSKVIAYWADYWLLAKESERHPKKPQRHSRKSEKRESWKFDYLAYSQTILMEMDVSIDGGQTFKRYVFPHITANTVRKVPGTPTQARHATKSKLEE